MEGEALLPPFWSLVQRHGSELLAYARRLSGEDGEDVLQEAFLRALRSYPGLRDGDHLRAWLFRITTTTAFDHHARTRRRAEVLTADVEGPAAPVDEVAAFEALLDGLRPEARRALSMRFLHDLEYEDMAGRLGCSPAAARQRVSVAVRELRRRMA